VSVTQTITATGCDDTDELEVTVEAIGLSGVVAYYRYDATNTPLGNMTVKLLDASNSVLATTTTNSSGYYQFVTVPVGAAKIEVSTTRTWGGGNSTDALAIERRAIMNTPFFWVPANYLDKVGDVNPGTLPMSVNATDALYVRQRAILMITSFPSGDWAFWDASTTYTGGHPDPRNFTNLNASTARLNLPAGNTLNIWARCYGDANGSYTVAGSKSLMSVHHDHVSKVAPGVEFELPLTVENAMEFGALTLFMKYDESKIEVGQLVSAIPGLSFVVEDGWVKAAWSNLTPLSLKAGDTLFTLVAMTRTAVTEEDDLFFLSSETEFADRMGNVIGDYKLGIDRVDNDHEFALNCYPNPFSSSANVVYSLSLPARVKVTLVNTMGMVVAELVNQHHTAGTFNTILYPTKFSMGRGMYYIRMEAEGEGTSFSTMVKVIYIE
jgi:hypothetical protein